MKSLLGPTLLALAIATPAYPAGMLYKSVDGNGSVTFSDTAPSGTNVKILEQRALSPLGAPARAAPPAAPPLPLAEGDEALNRANEQVDLAEHALALARRNLWSPDDGMKMQPARVDPAELERVEFYKKNLRSARTDLVELVRDRQAQALAVAAVPGAPIVVAVNYLPRR